MSSGPELPWTAEDNRRIEFFVGLCASSAMERVAVGFGKGDRIRVELDPIDPVAWLQQAWPPKRFKR